MAIALKQIAPIDGIEKEEVEQALFKISQQLENIDEKLKTRMDNERWRLFQEEQQEIERLETTILKLLHYK